MKKIFFSSLLVLLTMIGIAPTVQAQSTPQYGEELLTNIPPDATDFTGWTTSSSNSKCIPQCSEGWFKTSYEEGTISQTIDLAAKGYTPIAENTLFLYAATEYKVGWATGNRDGSAQMYVECLDAEGNVLATNTVLNRTGKFGTVETTLVCDMFTIPANTTQLRYVLKGKDQCYWGGHFGPWFRNMSCQVWDSAKFNETIKVSVVPALGDSITLSKTSDFHFGDTITVSATYPEHPILWFSINKGVIINTNQVVCWGDSIVVNAHLKYDHAITCNGTHATIKANPAQAGMGDTVTLSYTMDENCIWGTYTTDIDVKWIDANRFIMPDEAVTIGNTAIVVKSIPYFEGFEEGNTDQKNVAGWLQQSESGDRSWVANSTQTDYNRTPYAGSWNATLYGYNTDWLFQAFTLEADKEYAFSMWARSYDSSNILVQLGNQANKNAMSVTVVPTTTLSTKDYQYLSGKITVETTGTYVIGIRGYSFYSSNAISIDSIMVREAQAHTITLNGTHATLKADKAKASLGDTVTLSYDLDENCVFVTYTTNIDVKWIDANRFIMPDEAVTIGNTALAAKSTPYFEGFEEGNTDQENVAGWLQQSESGSNSWVANSTKTDYNRTPYAGSWNAYLYGYNTDWLFHAFTLEAGKEYAFSMWARSYNSSNILVQLGNQANKNAMSVTVVPTTTLSTKDYQYLSGKITVETTGTYVIGIRGYSDYSSNAISIDSIMVREAQAHTITLNGTHATLTADKATASVGDTVTLSYALDENCVFVTYTTDIDVKWIDANRFIMPDEAVTVSNTAIAAKPIPYFEGFEEGNTGQENVAGWLQQSESGSNSWVANTTNTDYNRTPYAGKWNATLYKNNTNWLFQYITLEQGKTYRFSMHARQPYSVASYANITVQLGTFAHKDSMQTTIVPQTSVINGDYQLITGTFSVETTGNYIIGIKGYISNYSYYLSIDDIGISEDIMHTISTTNAELGTITVSKNSAVFGDTVIVSHTMTAGIFMGYATNTPVHWISDTSFVVMHDDVIVGFDTSYYHTLPFFEGFENGNTDQKTVVGWLQQSEIGGYSWVANATQTDYNRTPYAGSWNATLYYSNTDWLYTVVPLKADTPYDISLYARQDGYSTSYANITVALGKAMDKDSMTINLIPQTGIKNGDYQCIGSTFSVPADGYYVLGIKGYMNSSPYYISLDNILLQEHTAHTIIISEQECGTLIATHSSAFIGDTVTLSYTMKTDYFFKDYTTNVPVQWVDANRFIMPAEDVTIALDAVAPKTIPYFEGFEDGNADQKKVADWLQQSENGDRSWVANSTQTGYNRTPYAGSWNATLYGYNTDWLFQAFTLEEGKEYAFSMWARSYNSSNILVQLGNQANKNAMSVTLVPTTTLSTKDYQYLSGKITVETTGTYVIGIRGYSDYSSNAISIDSIMVREAQAHAITLNGTHATLKADKATASVGDTVNLSSTMDENYVWVNYTTDINVRWIDANRFIMPDEAVTVGNTAFAAKPVPYFEGFEEGNTDQKNVAGWLQQSESGSNSWVANTTQTDRNRTPYAGSWNATLYYSNTDWLFQALALEAGENYALSLYARQDMDNTSYANITAALGDACNKDAMTTTILPAKGLTYGDYQLLTDTFRVAETKAYVLGIKGYINGTPYYISLDNILVSQEVYPLKDSLFFDVLTEEAVRTALAALTLTAVDTKGNTKHTFDNLAENWVLDLVSHKATYTVADSLLPMGYFFADSTATITVDLAINQYTLTIGDAENGSVKVAVNGKDTTATTFAYGTEVTLTATPAEHYHFVKWSNGATDATYAFTLTGDTTLTAEFAIDQYTITIGDAENGSVKVAVNGEETVESIFSYGTEITLTATANVGYSFEKWDDGNTDNPRVITLTEDVTITAIFKEDASTQLSETNAETKVQKVLRNGQVFIIRNGNTYDLTGRKLQSDK